MIFRVLLVILVISLTGGGRALANDPSAEAGMTASYVGHAVGAAATCENIAPSRVTTIAGRLAVSIATFTSSPDELKFLQKSYEAGVTEGQKAIRSRQSTCASADNGLAYWERPTTAWLAKPEKALAIIPFANAAEPAQKTLAQALAPAASPAAIGPMATPPVAAPVAVAAPAVHGITATEIRFGMAAPMSGPSKDLGRQMKLGIDAAFHAQNLAGGVNGRKLALIVRDDGYDPARTGEAMKQLYEQDQVFGFVGNVGTPTAMVALPYALSHSALLFGAFTGTGLLRRDPPDRYVFNYRASYAEETSAVVSYLVKVRRLRPEQIAVFAQQDGYGDAGFEGVAKAMRSLNPSGEAGNILRLNYQRNTVEVDAAVAQLLQYQRQRSILPIKAIVMVATYRAAARFIDKTHETVPGLTYTNVSFVGSTSLAEELKILGPKYVNGVIVTQVVPPVEGYSSVVIKYKNALAKDFPGEAPDYVSFEGFLDANILIEGLKRAGSQLDTEQLVNALETIHNLDIGVGAPVTFSPMDHQAVHKIWGTQLDSAGHFHAIDLQ